MLIKNQIKEPITIFIESFQFPLLTKSSAIAAPKNGQRIFPKTGITNGPANKPIAIPLLPVLNHFSPIQLETELARNKKLTNILCITQINKLNFSNERNRPFKIFPNTIKRSLVIIGYTKPTNTIKNVRSIIIQLTISIKPLFHSVNRYSI